MSSDNTVAKFKPLSNSNYPEWAGEMKAWLMRNGLWRIVSGRESKPADKNDLEKWEAKAERAAGEIYLMVENDQRVHFRGHEEDPLKMWELLEAAHLSKKPGARFNAYDDLFSIRKQDDETLVNLGVRIEKSMQTIQNLRPNNFTIDNLDEELQCMALIRALPEDYRHLSTSLLLMDKLDKSVIMQAFRSEELHRQRQLGQGESLNQAKAGGGKGKMNTGKKDPSKDGTCYYCKETGHWRSDCPSLKAKKLREESAKKAEGEKAAVTELVVVGQCFAWHV